MTDIGLDYSFARPSVSLLKAQGIKFVCRYLSYPSGKVIGKSEYDSYRNAGIEVFLNWEYDARDGTGGSSAGRTHAAEAVRQAKALGYPAGSTIYYSIGDFDVIGTGQTANCDAYAASAKSVTNQAGFRFGVYGSRAYLAHLRSKGLIEDGWESPSTFSNTPKSVQGYDPANHLHQVALDQTFYGSSVDKNQRVGVTYSSLHINERPTTAIDEGIDKMTPEEKADLKTANAISYALASGADTYWKYKADGTRVSVPLKAYYDKLAAVVVAKLPK